jgi:hypothetical protein
MNHIFDGSVAMERNKIQNKQSGCVHIVGIVEMDDNYDNENFMLLMMSWNKQVPRKNYG